MIKSLDPIGTASYMQSLKWLILHLTTILEGTALTNEAMKCQISPQNKLKKENYNTNMNNLIGERNIK